MPRLPLRPGDWDTWPGVSITGTRDTFFLLTLTYSCLSAFPWNSCSLSPLFNSKCVFPSAS